MRWHRSALLALTTLVAACGQHEPGIYDVPLAEAAQRLRQADLSGFIAARGCGVALDIAVKVETPQSLRWTVHGEGAELVHFGVRLSDAGGGKTRAQVDFPFNPALTDTLTAPSGAPALRQPLQGAVVELVDAAIDSRAYDAGKTGDERPQVEMCKAPPPKPQATSAFSDGPPPPSVPFGAPMTGGGDPADQAQPVLAPGAEQRLEDLPRPGN